MKKREEIEHEIEMANLEIRTALELKRRLRKELNLLCKSCENHIKQENEDYCTICLEVFEQELYEQMLREDMEWEEQQAQHDRTYGFKWAMD